MKNNFSLVTWLGDAAKISHTEESSDAHFKSYYPYVEAQGGPHCPIFLMAGYSRKELNRWPLVTLRDGWLPLTVFFQGLRPELFECRFAVPSDLWYVVPPEWQNRVDLYKVTSDAAVDMERPPRTVIISGSLSSDFATDDEIEQDLDRMAERLGGWRAVEKMQVSVLMTAGWGRTWWMKGEANQLKTVNKLFAKFKNSIETPSLESVLERKSFQGELLVELNRGRLLHETSLKHVLLSRGAGVLQTETEFDECDSDQTIRLSFHHSIRIGRWRPLSRSRFESYEDFAGYYREIALEGQIRSEGLKWIESRALNPYRS